ncbi:MAG: hypothetical protein SGPRY_014621 [Prymnesium sp.]
MNEELPLLHSTDGALPLLEEGRYAVEWMRSWLGCLRVCCCCCSPLEDKFHAIDERYGAVECLHNQPRVLAVHGFLSDEECELLKEKAARRLMPSPTYASNGARRGCTTHRTSSEALCAQREVPTIISKLTSLLLCEPTQLQTLSIVRYEEGQQFKPHFDASSGENSRVDQGFAKSTRLVSVM